MVRNVNDSLFPTTIENNLGAALSTGVDRDTKFYPNVPQLGVISPIDNKFIGEVSYATKDDVDTAIKAAKKAFEDWRNVPAPKRGQLIAEIGNIVRERKDGLATLITVEMGKTYQEALGEVQEWIDVCDFAVGLSRQLHGLTIASERPDHRMMEQWHPLGPIGIISAFNFPMAVWAWNAMIGLVCGNTLIWKPSEKTPFCALACQEVVIQAIKNIGGDMLRFERGLSNIVNGEAEVGELLTHDERLPLISATGSTAMGKKVGGVVGSRLGRSLLELGGNNACIVTESADLTLATVGCVFAAVGTCGQRCTSLRRLMIHESIYDDFIERMIKAYDQLKIGDPRDQSNHVGPLIDQEAVDRMYATTRRAIARDKGKVLFECSQVKMGESLYVNPIIIEIDMNAEVVQEETFAPILYVNKYQDFQQAIELQNSVKQGLSSAVFTNDIKEAERFLSPAGSDCGIANVNIGTSGAEIGGAFGGEKDTGGGRESGSDAWKQYMRRTTNTINYGDTLPLAQGIKFDL